MEITYLGHSSFRIKSKDCYVVSDPYESSMVGIKFPPVDASVVTISHDHKDHSAADNVKGNPIVITGPGEYEIKGVSILGYSSFHDEKKGEERGRNTIYVYEAEGLRVCHLGDLGEKLNEKALEEIGDVNILMIPVGGVFTINSKQASEIVTEIEPDIVLPMHFNFEGINKEQFGKLSPLEEFLKATGTMVERLPKLSVKKEDLMTDSTKTVVLERK